MMASWFDEERATTDGPMMSAMHVRCGRNDEGSSRTAATGSDPQVATVASYSSHASSHGDVHERTNESDLPNLPTVVKLLYGLNGVSLSLQYMPVMFIINTQVALPIIYLSTYGSISFLPWSFKPLYAIMSRSFHRPTLMTVLYLVDAALVLSYLVLPKGTVAFIFLLGFVKGVSDAWSEFCVGLYLIDEATKVEGVAFEKCASAFQSQAATARNSGSLVAGAASFVYFLYRQLDANKDTGMNRSAAITLLLLTAACNILAAMLVWIPTNSTSKAEGVLRDQGYSPAQTTDATTAAESESDASAPPSMSIAQSTGLVNVNVALDTVPNETTELGDYHSDSSYSSNEESVDFNQAANSEDGEHSDDRTDATSDGFADEYAEPSSATFVGDDPLTMKMDVNLIAVILLQLVVVVFAMKGPITDISSREVWLILIAVLSAGIFGLGVYASNTGRWKSKLHGTGLFLILRHAMPSDGMLMGSFLYTAFQYAPVYLQVHSLVGGASTTLSSWSYGRFLSKYSKDKGLYKLITFTTVLASVASLTNIFLIRQVRGMSAHNHAHHDNVNSDESTETPYPISILLLSLAIGALTAFTSEWAFLPDVILATASIDVGREMNDDDNDGSIRVRQHEFPEEQSSHDRDHGRIMAQSTEEKGNDAGIQYGAFISCINFGDQLGALLAGSLVSTLGISRENDWEHFDKMILLCSIFGVFALIFLMLLPKESSVLPR